MRQYIDDTASFSAFEKARTQAAQVRGGMYWHKGPPNAPEQRYLVRTNTSGAEKSLGPRSPETEQIYAAFMRLKHEAQVRLGGLKKAVEKHTRLNRALRAGRVVPVVVEILNRLADSQLGEHFRVVGTHALYAYEAAAGVRFDDGALATRETSIYSGTCANACPLRLPLAPSIAQCWACCDRLTRPSACARPRNTPRSIAMVSKWISCGANIRRWSSSHSADRPRGRLPGPPSTSGARTAGSDPVLGSHRRD